MTGRDGREWADAPLFQPTVVDENGNPLTGWTQRASVTHTVTALQHGGGGDHRRFVDAASPSLREAVANLLVVVRATALLLVTVAATATVLIVIVRVWGWLI